MLAFRHFKDFVGEWKCESNRHRHRATTGRGMHRGKGTVTGRPQGSPLLCYGFASPCWHKSLYQQKPISKGEYNDIMRTFIYFLYIFVKIQWYLQNGYSTTDSVPHTLLSYKCRWVEALFLKTYYLKSIFICHTKCCRWREFLWRVNFLSHDHRAWGVQGRK